MSSNGCLPYLKDFTGRRLTEFQRIIMEKTKKGFHYSWVICFVGFMVMCFPVCITSNCVGVFVKPVCEALGISRSAFSLVTTFMSVSGIIFATQASKIYSRFTIKKVMMACSVCWPILYAVYGIAPSIYIFYIVAFLIGICTILGTSMAVSSLLNNWFTEKRGLALSIYATGSGIGGIFLNPIISKLIATQGYQKTYLILAAVIAAAYIPCTFFLVKDKPEDKGLEPYGGRRQGAKNGGELSGMTLDEAKKSPMLYLCIPTAIIISMGCIVCMQQTVAYVQDIGYDYTFAAKIAAVMAASLAVCKLVLGQMYDKLGSRITTIFSILCFAAAMILYGFAENVIILYISVIIVGFGLAFYAVGMPIVVQDAFGKKDFSSIFGIFTMCSSVGSLIGGPAVASVYDNLGTYKPAWIALAALMIGCALLINIMFGMLKKQKISADGSAVAV